ncbi:MAG: 50S ribosomal protein L25 [Spirochaetaceae bacterium]|nr:50S ribosomal protein L25 [Spirochaetaceae bacterium]
MDQFVVVASTRKDTGKRAARKLRQNGRLPAVMYNSKGESVMLEVDEVEFTKVWKNATPSTLVNLKVDGKDNLAFIKDTEYDIKSDKNLHVDFHVIDEDKPLKMTMKIQLTGNPAGVREGGRLTTHYPQIVIQCLPKDLPPRVCADVSALGIGHKYYVKDIPLADGVTVLTSGENLVASVSAPKR